MESSSTSVSRSTSGRGRTSDRERDEKGGIKLKIPLHKPTRYKEKFQALRERYDRVTAAHVDYQRDLDIAAAKLKDLQAENDYLLDAINVAEPDITTILSPLHHNGISAHAMPPEPRADIDNNNAGITSRTPLESPHMNGNSSARHTNGNRHRPIKPEEHDFPVDQALFAHSSRV